MNSHASMLWRSMSAEHAAIARTLSQSGPLLKRAPMPNLPLWDMPPMGPPRSIPDLFALFR